jgi:hypothetical protein
VDEGSDGPLVLHPEAGELFEPVWGDVVGHGKKGLELDKGEKPNTMINEAIGRRKRRLSEKSGNNWNR